MARGQTLKNAVIGAAVALVAFFIPFLNSIAPLLGGGVSGYLQREGITEGGKTGVVTGIVLTTLAVLIGILVTLLFSGPQITQATAVVPGVSVAAVYVGVLVVAVVLVIVGGVGGAIGGAINSPAQFDYETRK